MTFPCPSPTTTKCTADATGRARALRPRAVPSGLMALALASTLTLLGAACGSDATLYVDDAEALIDAFRSDAGADRRDGDSRGDAGGSPDTGSRDTGSRDTGGRDTPPRDAGSDSSDRPDAGDTNTGLGPACVDVPATLDFGTRIAAQAHELVLWIENCGDLETDDVRIGALSFVNEGGVSSAPEFYFADPPELPLVVPPFDRYPLQVRYRSDAAGSHTAVIRMTTNDPTRPTIDVAVSAEVR